MVAVMKVVVSACPYSPLYTIDNMKVRRSTLACMLLMMLLPSTGFAVDAEPETDAPVRVVSLDFIIDGKTLEVALRRVMKIKEDMEFDDLEALEDFLARDIQELKNLRIFTLVESQVDFIPSIGGGGQADITVSVTDTWSIFPFIVPSSNGSATVITLAVVDKNFAGSLTELRLSGDLGIGTDPLTNNLEIPRWGVYLNWSGITVNQWQFSTRIVYQYETERKFLEDVLIEDFSYYESQFFLDVRYEFRFLRNLYYHIIPSVGGRHGYDVRIDGGNIEYEYFYFGLGQALDYRRIDWTDFYRSGWALGLLNALWSADDGSQGLIKTSFIGRLSGYGILGPVNPNGRFLAYYAINTVGTGLARFLRGVRNDTMYGNRIFVLNTGIQIRLHRWSWLEPHLQPFIDAGIAAEPGEAFDWRKDFHLGIGTELILFFPTLPSLQIRGFIGFDATVEDWSSSAKVEAGFSFDLFY